jgi:hypothetical protein
MKMSRVLLPRSHRNEYRFFGHVANSMLDRRNTSSAVECLHLGTYFYLFLLIFLDFARKPNRVAR